MDQATLDQLETTREVEDLNDQIRDLRRQIDFRDLQLRTLRVRVNRYERILGMEEAA